MTQHEGPHPDDADNILLTCIECGHQDGIQEFTEYDPETGEPTCPICGSVIPVPELVEDDSDED